MLLIRTSLKFCRLIELTALSKLFTTLRWKGNRKNEGNRRKCVLSTTIFPFSTMFSPHSKIDFNFLSHLSSEKFEKFERQSVVVAFPVGTQDCGNCAIYISLACQCQDNGLVKYWLKNSPGNVDLRTVTVK